MRRGSLRCLSTTLLPRLHTFCRSCMSVWIPIPRGPDRSRHGWRVPVVGQPAYTSRQAAAGSHGNICERTGQFILQISGIGNCTYLNIPTRKY